jgi:hypothetical protein
MANKSTIELTYTKDVYSKTKSNGLYKVTRIVNSLNYRPGDYLEEDEVKTLCKGSRFTVTIK